MAVSLDEVDIRLLRELEQDADRPNVQLARIVGLSPAATLNRVRRLKEEGVITGIHAHVDARQAGLPRQGGGGDPGPPRAGGARAGGPAAAGLRAREPGPARRGREPPLRAGRA